MNDKKISSRRNVIKNTALNALGVFTSALHLNKVETKTNQNSKVKVVSNPFAVNREK